MDEGFDGGMLLMPSGIGYALLTGLAMVGMSCGASWGAVPWDATSPATLLMLALSLWLAMASAAALASGGRMAHFGLFCTMLASVLSVTELTRSMLPAMASFVSEGSYIWVYLLLLMVIFPIVAAPLSVRRMRETLWQDVNWSSLDASLYILGIVKASWILSHAGSTKHDRFAIVTSSVPEDRLVVGITPVMHFVVDKMRGQMALVDDPEFAESLITGSGYDVEHIEDSGNVVRRHEYPFSPSTRGGFTFMNPPARGISADEYYGRL
jgi:hypothetical protein